MYDYLGLVVLSNTVQNTLDADKKLCGCGEVINAFTWGKRRRIKRGHNRQNGYSKYADIPHVCYACGSDKTYVCKNGTHTWLLNEPTDLMLCKTCYNEYIYRPKQKARGDYHRFIHFKGKLLLLKSNPRKGICIECGKYGYTHLHHDEYDESNVLAHTRELCPSCHAKESWRLGQLVSRIKR